MRLAVLATIFAACAVSPPPPITGTTQRFAVDGFTLPTIPGQAAALGFDFNGDGVVDNALGDLTGVLAGQDDLTGDAADLVADGVVASSLELTVGDDGVGIRYKGAGSDDPVQLHAGASDGGAIATDGVEPGRIDVVLPALVDADPTPLALEQTAMQLAPDGEGDGFDVGIQALADANAFGSAAAAGLVQMVYANPRAHLVLESQLDTNHDGVVTAAEAARSPLVATFAEPDVGSGISVGFVVHVSPCAAGSCVQPAVGDHCHDRLLDGDETGLDCGGSCVPCGAGVACAIGADCDSGACDGGACRAPACDDGVLDGFETDLDCGGGGCGGCALGQRCISNSDCAGGTCDSGGYAFGTCA